MRQALVAARACLLNKLSAVRGRERAQGLMRGREFRQSVDPNDWESIDRCLAAAAIPILDECLDAAARDLRRQIVDLLGVPARSEDYQRLVHACLNKTKNSHEWLPTQQAQEPSSRGLWPCGSPLLFSAALRMLDVTKLGHTHIT